MKFRIGNWVIVTRRRMEGPDLELKGKVIEATPDYAVAECWFQGEKIRFTMSDDTQGLVHFRKAKHSDFRRR